MSTTPVIRPIADTLYVTKGYNLGKSEGSVTRYYDSVEALRRGIKKNPPVNGTIRAFSAIGEIVALPAFATRVQAVMDANVFTIPGGPNSWTAYRDYETLIRPLIAAALTD